MENVCYPKYYLIITKKGHLDLNFIHFCTLALQCTSAFSKQLSNGTTESFCPIIIVLSFLHKINHFRMQTGAQLGSTLHFSGS